RVAVAVRRGGSVRVRVRLHICSPAPDLSGRRPRPGMATFGRFRCAAILLLVLCILHVDFVRGQITHPTEVSALNAVRGRLIDPMYKLKKWNRGDPCTSNWTGVICHKIPNDAYLHVTELELFNMNLSGTLAPEVGLLSQLNKLDFMWNNLTGNIPKEIGNITTLTLM
uniref:Leucine-rich repeat-containing N-terminal plant-type domain-containing protein n=1 Tax=Aegilops tauschii subsp. strangulata TaxID=200361 RepID=A0A453FTB0_AEGTS